MGIVKFKTGFTREPIERVEVLRETKASVYVPTNGFQPKGEKERREAKMTEYAQYHDTWEAAHEFLMVRAQAEVAKARRSLELANSKLGNIKGMKPPKGDQ
jgi:hypothetical protein